MGDFTFAYKGYDPHVALLTRNTFDPLDTLLTRLGVVQYIEHSQQAKRAEKKLVDTLEQKLIQYEEEHPVVARIMQEIVTTLSNMGL